MEAGTGGAAPSPCGAGAEVVEGAEELRAEEPQGSALREGRKGAGV